MASSGQEGSSLVANVDARDPIGHRPPARTIRPQYIDRLPPCNHACPAGENVQAWLAEAQAGRYREAWDIIVRDNPMPAVHGRVLSPVRGLVQPQGCR